MTTLQNDTGKTIQYSISNVIHECDGNMYIVETPTIICDNKKDAERIQTSIGAFTGDLIRKLIKE